ncbi:MAG: glycoside hydrolase family 2 protein, partial [Clostridia bacterium]|nr:glycoside hydrolase family 2 protein [Clostridia bacterium]
MRTVLNFNTNWVFAKEITEAQTEINSQWEAVCLPHTWNAVDGIDGGNDYFRGTCCYAKSFRKEDLGQGEEFYLELQGANSSADVYLNGKHLAHHDGGYSTWRVNLTEALAEENILSVLVDNAANDRVYPQMADFTFYGGLYRNVNLIAVSKTHFDLDYYGGPGLAVTPIANGADYNVEVEVYLSNPRQGDRICYTLTDKEGNVVAQTVSENTKESFVISNAHLWNGRKDPHLYTAKALLLRGEEELDAVSTRFGCRSFQIDPYRGF